MTVSQALRTASAALAKVSDTARLDAEVLMAHALDANRSDLLLRHMGDPVPEGFAQLVERRLNHEPVAYIIGHQEFYGRDFIVNSDVLIPRGDSETIVAAALEACPCAGRVLDCGTGSGALLLTVMAEGGCAEGVGVDCSLGALAVAAANAARLGLAERVHMLHGDWHEPAWSAEFGRFDLILTNPPYVEEDADLAPSVRQFEPAGALFAGAEGLDDYRILIPQLRGLLAPGGVVVLEIGYRQAEAVGGIAGDHGFATELRRDLAGRPRALILR